MLKASTLLLLHNQCCCFDAAGTCPPHTLLRLGPTQGDGPKRLLLEATLPKNQTLNDLLQLAAKSQGQLRCKLRDQHTNCWAQT